VTITWSRTRKLLLSLCFDLWWQSLLLFALKLRTFDVGNALATSDMKDEMYGIDSGGIRVLKLNKTLFGAK